MYLDRNGDVAGSWATPRIRIAGPDVPAPNGSNGSRRPNAHLAPRSRARRCRGRIWIWGSRGYVHTHRRVAGSHRSQRFGPGRVRDAPQISRGRTRRRTRKRWRWRRGRRRERRPLCRASHRPFFRGVVWIVRRDVCVSNDASSRYAVRHARDRACNSDHRRRP